MWGGDRGVGRVKGDKQLCEKGVYRLGRLLPIYPVGHAVQPGGMWERGTGDLGSIWE